MELLLHCQPPLGTLPRRTTRTDSCPGLHPHAQASTSAVSRYRPRTGGLHRFHLRRRRTVPRPLDAMAPRRCCANYYRWPRGGLDLQVPGQPPNARDRPERLRALPVALASSHPGHKLPQPRYSGAETWHHSDRRFLYFGQTHQQVCRAAAGSIDSPTDPDSARRRRCNSRN